MKTFPSPRRFVPLETLTTARIPLAVAVAAFALVPLGASAAPTSFQLVFDGHTVVAQCPPACNSGQLEHVGTFTTNDALCPSGHTEDINQTLGKGIDAWDVTRLFTCDGSGATFTATIHPMHAENGGPPGVWQITSGSGPLADLRGTGSFTSVITGGDLANLVTITFRSTWTGTVDLDATPPTLALTKHTAAKLSRPAGRYRLNLTLAISDNDGGPVSYSLTLTDPTTLTSLVHKSGSTSQASINWAFVLKPDAQTRALRLEIDASDAVGNQTTIKQKIALKK